MKQVTLADPSELIWHRFQNSYCRDEAGKLTALNLCGQQITDAAIQKLFREEDLSQLQSLNLSENQLTRLTIPASAIALRHLNVSENESLKVLELPDGLSHLETLNASQCKLEDLEFPRGYTSLKTLDLRQNALRSISFQEGLPQLKELNLGGNQLQELTLPRGFQELQYLYLPNNKLERLTLGPRMTQLQTLHLRGNLLRSLPENFLSLTGLKTLYLYENPNLDIPKEVIASGEEGNSRDDVWNHFNSIKVDGKRTLHQAKMILVGNGFVGKTSIKEKLLDKEAPLPDPEDRTQGLDVVPYVIQNVPTSISQLEKEIDFRMSIWDFGGQGRYREVQQLFCSRKSLYIFVTSFDDTPTKEDYVGFEYWLSMVNGFSYDRHSDQHSPVIHVVNKIDLQPMLIDQKYRNKIFPNIHSQFLAISCATLKNFPELEATIQEVLPHVSPDIFTDDYSNLWMDVKEELEQMEQHHILYAEYEAICLRSNMSKAEAQTWIRILDRIGTVIYFGDHPDLKDWVILNPGWVKDAMYQVLDSDLVQEEGLLKPTHFKRVWKDNSPEEHEKFVAMILAYKLGYEKKTPFGKSMYVIPALLPDIKPEVELLERTPDYQIKFCFDPFLPAGTVNKLIVSLQQGGMQGKDMGDHPELERGSKMRQTFKGHPAKVFNNLMWKNNVILHDSENNVYVHLEEVWEDHAVYANLYEESVKDLYEEVFSIMKRLNQDLKDTKLLDELQVIPEGWYKNKKWWSLLDLEELEIDFFTKETDRPQESDLDQVEKLVAQRRLDVALEQLEQISSSSDEYRSEVLLLKGRLQEVITALLKGTEDNKDLNREKNRIANAILDLCKKIRKDQQ